MNYRSTNKIVGSIFMAIGIIAGIVCIFLTVNNIKYRNNYKTIKAVITNVYSNGCQVEYTYDGEEYVVSQYNYHSSSMRVGKPITVYINPDEPYEFKMKELGIFGVVFSAVFFAVFFTVGICLILATTKGNMKINPNWTYINAEVIDVVPNTSVYINGVNPLKVVCEYNNPYTGKKEQFFSKNCMDDPGDVYEPNEPIKVYVKDDTHKRYKVDLTKFYELGKR